jgi:hypothetical protein
MFLLQKGLGRKLPPRINAAASTSYSQDGLGGTAPLTDGNGAVPVQLVVEPTSVCAKQQADERRKTQRVGNLGVPFYSAIMDPNGNITNQSSTGTVGFNLTNRAAGTYRIFVVPNFAVTGSAQVSLTLE